MASGVLGLLLLVGYTATFRIFGSVKNTMANVVNDGIADLSLRGLDAQLRHSHLDRSDLVRCGSQTLLRKKDSVQQRVSSLSAAGDSLAFVYTERNLLGATHPTRGNAIKVADATVFQAGDLVYLKSLNSQSMSGLFSVSGIDLGDSSLDLSTPATTPPDSFPCTLNSSSFGNPSIFDTLKALKFSVELIRVANYNVETSHDGSGALSMFFQKWPLRGQVFGPYLVFENLEKFKIEQEFIPSTENKGEFKISIAAEYGTTERKSRRSIASGYAITGMEITNQRAVPQPPMLDDLYVTCSFRSTLLMDEFVMDQSKDRIPVYRIEPSYTEGETLSGSRSPNITASIVSNGVHDNRFNLKCWDEDELNHSENGSPSLPQKNTTSTMTFHLNKDGSAYKPIFCFVPDASQLKGSLTYISITQKEVKQRMVNCTPVLLEGTPGRIWKYDESGPTRCYRRSGVINIGRLTDSKDNDRAGPYLYTTSESCSWSGSNLQTCDASIILAANPKAELLSVQLFPTWVQIAGAENPLKVTCE